MVYAHMSTAPKVKLAEAAIPLTKQIPAKEPVVSKGVPKFGEASIAATNRPKIEIIGEACESCSA